MAESQDVNGTQSAEKAYASAAEKALADGDAKPQTEVASALAFPAKPDRVREAPVAKAENTAADTPAPASAPKIALPAELEADLVKPAMKRSSAPKAVRAKPAPAATPARAAKPAPAIKKAAKAAAAKKVAAPKPVKLAKPKITTAPAKSVPAKIITRSKETPMATKKTTDFTSDIKSFVADAQTKAKIALGKGNAVLGEASEFTKGNVEAVVTSGKILAAGFQDMGKSYVAEGKAAVETVTADVKALAAVKSPSDFVQLQSTILRRNVDQAIALSSKNTEAMLKLVSDAFAPISARASLAVQKIKQAA
jgi:hypothetical protein